MLKTKSGFTIIELLIVIVVIGILAAITIVAYNGIQSRATETTVQSDLANFSKKVNLFQADNGFYPRDATDLNNSIRMPFTRSVYIQTDGNFMYCASSGGAAWMLIVRATNSKNYYISSGASTQQYTGPGGTPATMCNSTGFVTAGSTWGFEPSIVGWGNPGYRVWTAA